MPSPKRCTPLSAYSRDNTIPQRLNNQAVGCMCNRFAYWRESDVCTVICENIHDKTTCYCKDRSYAGSHCSYKICKHRGRPYCQGMFRECGDFVTHHSESEWEQCRCYGAAKLVDGKCECPTDYRGEFCEDYYNSKPMWKGPNRRDGLPPYLTILIILVPITLIMCCRLAYEMHQRRRNPYPAGRWPNFGRSAIESNVGVGATDRVRSASERARPSGDQHRPLITDQVHRLPSMDRSADDQNRHHRSGSINGTVIDSSFVQSIIRQVADDRSGFIADQYRRTLRVDLDRDQEATTQDPENHEEPPPTYAEDHEAPPYEGPPPYEEAVQHKQ